MVFLLFFSVTVSFHNTVRVYYNIIISNANVIICLSALGLFLNKSLGTRLLQWATRKLQEVDNMHLFREIDYYFFITY